LLLAHARVDDAIDTFDYWEKMSMKNKETFFFLSGTLFWYVDKKKTNGEKIFCRVK